MSQVVVPYIVAAARSFGVRLWSKAEDAAVGEASEWGSRLALRFRGEAPAVAEAVDDVAADPENPDTHAALRLKVGKALTGSPELLADVVELLRQARQATVTGPITDSVVVTGDRSVGSAGGSVITGDHNSIGGSGVRP
ncbi:hypothetical protein [Actinoplanes sp. NPDC049118]|uniref:hypothetical protein n=1 Tax=Actinoplanes sp. NPDC049118 TaxID=3155769 RepID=UPI00340F8DCA